MNVCSFVLIISGLELYALQFDIYFCVFLLFWCTFRLSRSVNLQELYIFSIIDAESSVGIDSRMLNFK